MFDLLKQNCSSLLYLNIIFYDHNSFFTLSIHLSFQFKSSYCKYRSQKRKEIKGGILDWKEIQIEKKIIIFLKFHIFQFYFGKENSGIKIMFSCLFISPWRTHKSDAKARAIKPNESYQVLPYCIALKCHKPFYKDKFPLKCSNTVRVENKMIFALYTSYPQRKNTKRSSDVVHKR